MGPIAIVRGSEYAPPILNRFAIWPAQVFMDTVGKTKPLNTSARTLCKKSTVQSVQECRLAKHAPEHVPPAQVKYLVKVQPH